MGTQRFRRHRKNWMPAFAGTNGDCCGEYGFDKQPVCRRHSAQDSTPKAKPMDIVVKDSNGTQLAEGDTVTVIKDLKLKGSSTVIKRGTVIKNIRFNGNEDEIEGRTDKVKGLVLRTEFLKKS
jgi:protein PhnA